MFTIDLLLTILLKEETYMNVVSALVHNAKRISDKTAIVYEDRSYTYHEFNEAVNRFANGLIDLGVKKGEKVALMMKNSDHFAISYFACAKVGAIIVPMNFRLVEREIAYILDQSDSALVISDSEFETLIDSARQNIPDVRQVITVEKSLIEGNLSIENVSSNSAAEPNVEIKDTDDIHILYTSGTTGNPKGALFDHQRVTHALIGYTGTFGYDSEEKFLHIAPLFHSAQLMIYLLSSIFIGGFNVIHRDFNPQAVYRDIEKYKITHFFAIPTMYRFMLAYKEKEQYDVSSIMCFAYGAAPMSASEVNQSMEFFQSTNFYSLCGLTEGGPSGVYLSPVGHMNKAGVSGKDALLFTEAKLVNFEGEETKVGEVGELILKGEPIMKEYYNKPEETAVTLVDGWLYTGDLAIKDDEGYMTLVDRNKDMIISGGENVYSVEVENILIGHPQVEDVAVIASADPQWGEIVTAVIVPKDGNDIDLEDLSNFCRKDLAAYKIPRKVIIETELPRNASGKLRKFELREKVETPTD